MNFGPSPLRRTLLFDVNDFDETIPGPFEWDIKRLAASLEIAARAGISTWPPGPPSWSGVRAPTAWPWRSSPACATSRSGTPGWTVLPS